MTSALPHLTVLDLATFVAAPFCCTLLGEFGAYDKSGTPLDLRVAYIAAARTEAEVALAHPLPDRLPPAGLMSHEPAGSRRSGRL